MDRRRGVDGIASCRDSSDPMLSSRSVQSSQRCSAETRILFRGRACEIKNGDTAAAGRPGCSRFSGTPFDQDLLQIFSALEDQARESARTYMLLAQSPCMAPRKLLSLAFCLFVSCFLSSLSLSLSLPLFFLSLSSPTSGRSDCDM